MREERAQFGGGFSRRARGCGTRGKRWGEELTGGAEMSAAEEGRRRGGSGLLRGWAGATAVAGRSWADALLGRARLDWRAGAEEEWPAGRRGRKRANRPKARKGGEREMNFFFFLNEFSNSIFK